MYDSDAEFLKAVKSNGFAAQCLGESRESCPYKSGPWATTAAWLEGYDEAAAICADWCAETLEHKPTTGLTCTQTAWAKQHDWFLHATDTGLLRGEAPSHNFVVGVLERWTDADGHYGQTIRQFDNLSELRAWAGY